MTEEEHYTRAMLLGMTYHRQCKFYFYTTNNGGHYTRLDEDTLEELSTDEVHKRRKKAYVD